MHPSNPRRRRWLLLAALVLATLAAGCGEEPGIQTYNAPREDRHIPPPRTVAQDDPAAAQPTYRGQAPQGDDAMMVVMVQRGEDSWFYKTTGKAQAVAREMVPLLQLIGEVTYDEAGSAEWNVPEGWVETVEEQTGEGPQRLSTIAKGEGETRVELAISKFARMMPDQAQWELFNVNRWLGQLGYLPVTAEDMEQVIRRAPFAGETALVFFKVGQEGQQPTMNPLAAVAPPEGATPGGAATATEEAADAEIRYAPPESWRQGEAGGFRYDAYLAGEGAEQVEITVSRLGPSPLVPNVNRWRTQIGLAQQTEAEITAAMQTLSVGGEDVPYFELTSPADAAQRQTILAAIVPHGGSQWFFKMWGDPDAVAAEKSRFEEFVESVEFE